MLWTGPCCSGVKVIQASIGANHGGDVSQISRGPSKSTNHAFQAVDTAAGTAKAFDPWPSTPVTWPWPAEPAEGQLDPKVYSEAGERGGRCGGGGELFIVVPGATLILLAVAPWEVEPGPLRYQVTDPSRPSVLSREMGVQDLSWHMTEGRQCIDPCTKVFYRGTVQPA